MKRSLHAAVVCGLAVMMFSTPGCQENSAPPGAAQAAVADNEVLLKVDGMT